MNRRSFGALMVATLAGMTATRPAWATSPARDLEMRLQQSKAFPGTTSFPIDIGRSEVASDSAATQLFIASAIKTFIVCQYRRDVEAGRLSEDEPLPVNDIVRNSASSVLLDLTGTTPARPVLEAR
jgi:beta-lactamase class A